MLYARFTTSEGNFVARLFEAEAPTTVANFVGLAEGTREWTDPRTGRKVKTSYYDGTIFHRVNREVVQQRRWSTAMRMALSSTLDHA